MKRLFMLALVMMLIGTAAFAESVRQEGPWHIGEETLDFYGATGYQHSNTWQGKHFDYVRTSIKVRDFVYDEDGRLWVYGEVTSNKPIGCDHHAKRQKSGLSLKDGDDMKYETYHRKIRPWDYFMYFPTEIYRTDK